MLADITAFLIYGKAEKVFFHLVEFLGPSFSIMREKENRQKKTPRKCRG